MMNIKTQVKTIQVLALVLTFFNIKTTFAQTQISPENGATCVSTVPTLTCNNTSGNVTVEILDCNDNISSIGLSGYVPETTFVLDVIEDDLSGITYNPMTNTLFAVTNGGVYGSIYEAIYEVNLNGTIINTFNLIDNSEPGVTGDNFDDTEGIVHLYGRTFAVVEEQKGRIAIIDLPITATAIDYDDADIIQLPPDGWGNNNGIEGISYDPVTDQFHIVRESKKYYIVDMPTTFPEYNPTVTIREATDKPFTFLSEAAGIHYVGLTPAFANTDAANNRLIVDEIGQRVIEVNAAYDTLGQLSFDERGYEGITMDNNGTIYIVQEINKIHVYTNSVTPGVIHSATVSGDSYTVPMGILDGASEYCWRITDDNGTSPTYSFTTIASITVCASISSSENDVEESYNGLMSNSSSDLEFTYDSYQDRRNQKIGLRYENPGIPPGATIINAYIQFAVDEDSGGAVNFTIRGEAADNAAPFTLSNGNLSARATTQASVGWSPPDWGIVGERGTKQRTPDLKAILQEIVNRNGFDENSAVAFVISGSGTNKRVAESYEGAQGHGSPEFAPELCVTFTLETCDAVLPVETNISLWLEGPYNPLSNTMQVGTQYLNVLPTEQPYNDSIWNYNGTESIDAIDVNMVDWVLVSLRRDSSANSEVFKAAALLYNDGSINFLETHEPPDSLIGESFYIVVEHRNHLVVMSHQAIPIQLITLTNGEQYGLINYDFRQQDSYHTSTSIGQKQLPNGLWASITGDMNRDRDINGDDNGIRFSEFGLYLQYLRGDVNMDADVNGADRTILSPNLGYSSGVR